MSLTKVSNSMITGAPVNVLDFMTQAQVVAVQTGVYGSVTPAQITAAIQASINSFPSSGGDVSEVSWILPKGYYNIDSAVTFPTRLFNAELTFEGVITQTSATANGIVFSKVYYSVITGLSISTTWDSWANVRSGVSFVELGNTRLGIKRIEHFEKGLFLCNGAATGYNVIDMMWMRNNKYGIYATPDGTIAWLNANSFLNGNWENSHKATAPGSVGIYIVGPNSGNSFYAPIFESIHTGFELSNTAGWLISKPYYENTDVWANIKNCTSGTWINGHQPFDDTKFLTNANTKRVTFINTGEESTNGPTFQIDATGVKFNRFQTGTAAKNPYLNLAYSPNGATNCLTSGDHIGSSQIYNKCYETSTGNPPTVGVFGAGAICWNSTGTIGQPSGWICYQLGTAGTLVGVTGDCTIGSPDVTVNDATGLFVGMYITVGGGAFSANQIDNILGNVVTMTSGSGATVTGAAVTYFAPLWRALANFA